MTARARRRVDEDIHALIAPASPNIVLVGMQGTGKSTVGRELAARLGWTFLDLDRKIETDANRSIAEIFQAEGEAGFRQRERRTVESLGGLNRHVIATGGWTVGDAASRTLLTRLGRMVCLWSEPATIARRLPRPRPPLDSSQPAAIAELLARRRSVYDAVPFRVRTDDIEPATAAAHILGLLELAPEDDPICVAVAAPGQVSRVLIGAGLIDAAGMLMRVELASPRVIVVADESVHALHGPQLYAALDAAGIVAGKVQLPAGERAKTLATTSHLYDAFIAFGLERGDSVVALGGGAACDVAGFAAATYLRGVTFTAIPTSVLAMVDASIGGKTGVNLPQGKNLVGAFHFPKLVVIDPDLLRTLPEAEIGFGLAEVLKAAVIGDPQLLAVLDRATSDGVLSPARADLDWPELIARAVDVKAGIVSRDPFEGGEREHLNLGHSFAHAIERVTGYSTPHGAAVAVGLVAAARLAEQIGVGSSALAERIERIVHGLGLPTRLPADVDPGALLEAMALDKKRRAGRHRIVLPLEPGRVEVHTVEPDRLLNVLRELAPA